MSRALKSGGGRFLLRPLNAVFAAPSHAPLLRSLFASGRGLTGREAARASGVAQKAALDALGRLERAGVVRRTPAGRAFLFELRSGSRLVKAGILPLLEAEGAIRGDVIARLKRTLEGHVESGWIFGSAARGEERPESDLDILLLVRGRGRIEAIQKRVAGALEGLRRDFQIRPSLLVMTTSEFLGGLRKGKPFMKNVLRDAEGFVGRSPGEIGNGQ